MNQTLTAGDAVITLQGVEADEEFVVIRFSVQDLKDDQRNAGKPAALEPVLGTGPPKALPPHIGRLTDEAGGGLDPVGAEMESFGPGDGPEVRRAPKANRAAFALPESLVALSGNHRLRFEVSLEEVPIPSSWEEAEKEGVRAEPKPPIGPFVFDITIPIRQNWADRRSAAPRPFEFGPIRPLADGLRRTPSARSSRNQPSTLLGEQGWPIR